MRRIIGGKLYDTDTAEYICDISGHGGRLSRTDFGWEDTSLYKTGRGTFFIAGEGGAKTRWATPVGDGRTGGSGMTLVTAEKAQELCEVHGTFADFVRAFGEPEEG